MSDFSKRLAGAHALAQILEMMERGEDELLVKVISSQEHELWAFLSFGLTALGEDA